MAIFLNWLHLHHMGTICKEIIIERVHCSLIPWQVLIISETVTDHCSKYLALFLSTHWLSAPCYRLYQQLYLAQALSSGPPHERSLSRLSTAQAEHLLILLVFQQHDFVHMKLYWVSNQTLLKECGTFSIPALESKGGSYNLNVKYLPWAHVYGHLVPNWGCCL